MAGQEDRPELPGHWRLRHPVSTYSSIQVLFAHALGRSFVGTIVLMTVKNTSKATEAGLLISYYIVLSFWAAQGLGMSMLSRNVAGQTKKSVCVAMNFVAWATGNAIGVFCSCCF